MRRVISGLAAVSVILAGLGVVAAQPATDAPSSGSWVTDGTLSFTARSAAQVTIGVGGTATVSAQFFTDTGCADDTQAIPAVVNTSTNAVTLLSGAAPITVPDQASSIAGTAQVPPGSYALVLRYRCATTGSGSGEIAPATPVTGSLTITGEQLLTRACVATSPPVPCTSAGLPASAVPAGTSVTFAGYRSITWSDSQVTEEVASGTQSLESGSSSGGPWSSASASTCAATLTIETGRYYRCVSNGQGHTPVQLTVLPSSSDYVISIPVVTPAASPLDEAVTISAALALRYSDSSLWPAPTGSLFSVEYQRQGSTSWTRLISSRATISPGIISTSFDMPGTGLVRIVAGGTTSATATITELEATDDYSFGVLTLPSPVQPGATITATSTVKSVWSDGSLRDAADGTQVWLEYATAYQPGTVPETFRRIASGRVSSGSVTITATPQASGYWRMAAGDSAGTPTFVSVTGSAPIGLTASATPASGDTPFAGRQSSFTVAASLTGYVGTEELSLFARVGDVDFAPTGTFRSSPSITGTYRLRMPSVGGTYAPEFELRDPRGAVVATATGPEIFVDGYASYELTLAPPSRPLLEGRQGRFEARVVGVTIGGEREAVDWTGRVTLERGNGSTWRTVATVSRTSGSVVYLRTVAVPGDSYRVVSEAFDATSPAITPEVLTLTGEVQLGSIRASDQSIYAGDSVTVSASYKVQYSNGRYYAGPEGKRVLVQAYTNGSWRTVRQTTSDTGEIESTIRPKKSASYRLALAGGAATAGVYITVTPVVPTRLLVDWPRSLPYYGSAEFVMGMRSNSGGWWQGRTLVQFQYRQYSGQSWRTVAKFRTKERYEGVRLTLTGYFSAGEYRFYVPQYGLSNSARYG